MAKIRVGILGGSGYGGSELLRILLFHPHVDVVLATANRLAGRPVAEAHPNLSGLTGLVFDRYRDPEQVRGLDCLFLALPHGESSVLVPEFPRHLRVLDLAGDFRLEDAAVFERSYGFPHPAMDHQRDFVYGLTEVFRKDLESAGRVANPGCFATALLIGLYPLIQAGVTTGRIVADAKTGSSGSGATAGSGTHHPVRANSFYAYKSFRHQHLPEVLQALRKVRPGWDDPLVFQTHSAPFVRGIFASIYCCLHREMAERDVRELFVSAYQGSFFVRLVADPNVVWVKNTNFADLAWALDGKDLIVFVAIDNLVKGAAGQAVQNMNLMFGFEERTGLVFPGGHP